MATEQELREQMVLYCRRLWDRGLVGAAEGNVSVRVDAHRVLVTPRKLSLADLTATSLVVVDRKRRWVSGGEPTSELDTHLAVYEAREDVGAVVHAHPPVATGFTVAGETLPQGVLGEVDLDLGPVALVPYGEPASGQAAVRIRPFLAKHDVFLLAHHGAVTLGADLAEAYNRMEILERCAQVLLTARTLGKVNRIPATEPETPAWKEAASE